MFTDEAEGKMQWTQLCEMCIYIEDDEKKWGQNVYYWLSSCLGFTEHFFLFSLYLFVL